MLSGNNDGAVILWDLEKGNPLFNLEVEAKITTDISFSPDGALFARSTNGPMVEIRDPNRFVQLSSRIDPIGAEARYDRVGMAHQPSAQEVSSPP